VPKIFISYRRGDCGAFALIVINHLREHYGADAVLSRRRRALPGEDIREHIARFIRQFDVVVAMVGPSWAGRKRDGRTRLSDESDRIRLEIKSALAHGIVIVPVLIGDFPILAAELPESIKKFSCIEPLRLATQPGSDLTRQLDRLVARIDRVVTGKRAGNLHS
jgi:hypothetical protein